MSSCICGSQPEPGAELCSECADYYEMTDPNGAMMEDDDG